MNQIAVQHGGKFTRVNLELPDGIEAVDWLKIGAEIVASNEAVRWWIGDWINYGERNYGKTYSAAKARFGKEVLGPAGYEEKTLINSAYVARSVQSSLRREDLSFSHHMLVAAMEPEGQKRWLTNAHTEGWTLSQFKAALKAAGIQPTRTVSQVPPGFNPLPWIQKGLSTFRAEFEALPPSKWNNERIMLTWEKLEPIDAKIIKPVRDVMQERGLLS